MKKTLRLLFFFSIIASVILIFSLSAYAVPAAPGVRNDGGNCKSHVGTLLTLSDIEKTASKRNSGPMRAPSIDPATSDIPLAIIVVGFENQPYRDDFDWSQEIFKTDRSLAEYYTDMSFGKFTFTPVRESSVFGSGGNTNAADSANDGIIHVTLPMQHDDWTLDYTYMSQKDIATNRSLDEMLIAAINAADAYVDFSSYDVNRDAEITTDELALGFVVGGYEAATSLSHPHGLSAYLWSHAYSLLESKTTYGFTFALPTPDNVKVNSYIAISEQDDDETQTSIATLAHELGHYIGLPDLYDTDYLTNAEWSDYGVNFLSLMDFGMYGLDPESGETAPYSLDAWSRNVLGWVDAETAGKTGDFTLNAQNFENDASYGYLRIDTQNAGEYFILENRGFEKWDAGLKEEYDRENGGIIIWHVDDSIIESYLDDNTVNKADHRPGIMPLYAESAGGTYSFIGKNRSIDLNSGFFDKSGWESRFASLGETLDLPLYGTGSDANKRDGRTLSGTKLMFLSDGGSSMTVRLNPGFHVHETVYTVVIAPNCTEPGAAYYYCEGCGKTFADQRATEEITRPFVVDPLGHTEPDKDGNCTRCGEHIKDVPGGGDEQPANVCRWCGKTHGSGFIDKLVAFFHNLFAAIFGAKY